MKRDRSLKEKKAAEKKEASKKQKIVAPGGKAWLGTEKQKTAKPVIQEEWNSRVQTSKYFDPKIDQKEYARVQSQKSAAAQPKANKAPASAQSKTHLSVKNELDGRYQVDFQSKNGTTRNTIEFYSDIDKLMQDKQPSNYRASDYQLP
jgi:hypothetical protein